MKRDALLEFDLVEVKILDEVVLDEKKPEEVALKVALKWQHADIINNNNRRYRKEILQREIKRIQPDLKTGKVFGAGYHPKEKLDTELPDIVLKWNSVKMLKNNECVGEALVLPTRLGKDAQIVIRAGGQLGISSRAYGTVTRRTEVIDGKSKTFDDVNDDFFLKAPGDIVLSPSVPEAKIRKIIESQFNEVDDSEEILGKEMKPEELTLEALKKDHPEVLKEHEAEVKKSAEAKTDTGAAKKKAEEELKAKIETAIEEKVKPLKEKLTSLEEMQKKSVEAVASFTSSYFDINKVEEEEEEEEDKDKGTKTDTSKIEKKVADLEKSNEDLKKKVEDKEKAEKEAKEKAESQKKIKVELDKALEKEVYKESIKKELEDGAKIEKVEDVEEAVKTAKEKISSVLTEAKKNKIISGDLAQIGKIDDPEGKKKELEESLIRRQYEDAVDSGYSGSFPDYKKLLEKYEGE